MNRSETLPQPSFSELQKGGRVLNDFIKEIRPGLVRQAKGQLWGNARDEAEDVVQTIMFRTSRRLPSLRQDTKLGDYLSGAVTNAVKDAGAAHGRREKVTSLGDPSENLLPVTESAESTVIRNSNDSGLLKSLSSVNPDFLQTLQLYMDGYTGKQIAEMLDISVGTVRSRVSRGRDAAKKALAGTVYEPRDVREERIAS